MNGRAIIYIRFSTPGQENGDSRHRQLQDCEAYCKTYQLDVVEIVEDLGRSAYRGDHLALGNMGKLTRRIALGEIDPGTTIVVEKMDRLSRQKPRILRRWLEDVCDRGLRIARVAGGPIIDAEWMDDGSNIAAMIDIAYQSSAGHDFSENISYRLSKFWDGKRERVKAGQGLLTAQVPMWLNVVGEWKGKNQPDYRRLEVDPERGATVVEIFRLAADGIGSWGIAKILNERKIPNWGRRTETSTRSGWNHTSVLNILRSPAVDGIHPLGRIDIQDSQSVCCLIHEAPC